MDEEWKFADPKNTMVFTLKAIVAGEKKILHVTHDEDDGAWQFLGLEDADPKEASIVSLEEIVTLDPTVIELYDLPLGWRAIRRDEEDLWWRKPKNG